MRYLLLIYFSFILFISQSCDNRLPWEKKYDELITFDKNEEIKKLEGLNINQKFDNSNKVKPRGKFYAFDENCILCAKSTFKR